MAERKSALKRAPERLEFARLLERAKAAVVTDEQLRELHASFLYGIAPVESLALPSTGAADRAHAS
jgi:hypothetical protein